MWIIEKIVVFLAGKVIYNHTYITRYVRYLNLLHKDIKNKAIIIIEFPCVTGVNEGIIEDRGKWHKTDLK